ncbi:sigma factor-like helix-turn-helix DNA-binding protein [Streptomyces scopuliridis]|uniref:sigma factor-like helix-turn-helix DNA-binding protein n=1 Tax=Streptomyces scopuliridis TaxID=452529 RepID=UPI000564CFF9|nr:sigma factor-like helix-turn-helix DNA-binding protein [Streptomyces scopuliridis]
MRERRAALDRRRAREFEAFAAGAAGRLLHAAVLLTGEPPDATPRAQRLLIAALSRTYAEWDRLSGADGEDPYDRARRELVLRFAREAAWRDPVRRGGRAAGVLGGLGPQERIVLVLRLYEGLAEEQTAALIGLTEERVRVVCARAVAAMREPSRRRRTRPGPSGLREAGP